MRNRVVQNFIAGIALLSSLGIGNAQQALPGAGTPVNGRAPVAATAPTSVPALVPYSGTAFDSKGKPLAGETSATFLIYKDQQGGEPLYSESQVVAFDEAGRYKVQLGAANPNGLPSDLFSSGEARWLEVQIAGETPQARVLLASVPYALKAADAATLGGLPASAFALAGSKNSAEALPAGVVANAGSTVTTTGGVSGYLPRFSGAATIIDSEIFDTGTEVGIGTTTPTATLDVNGTAIIAGGLNAEGGGNFGGSVNILATGNATASAGKASQPLAMVASAYNSSSKAAVAQIFRWTAEPTGNDTASPSSALELLFSSGSGTPTATGLSINGGGQITFAPGQSLPGADITGTINASGYDLGGSLFATGSASTQSTFLGFSGNTSNSGEGNTGTGYVALKSNTYGPYNTADGTFALYNNTTGGANTATGFQALYDNTTGQYNTASGASTLTQNTTGYYNTASGYEAMYFNSTGGYNTAYGVTALYSSTTGNYNTASGYEALYSNTTGYQNTASGAAALYANTSGYWNTASGVNALDANTTGDYNTATGLAALQSNTTGSDNTASGLSALNSNTTGNYNTASGLDALYSNTTGSDNTADGLAALYSNSTGFDNAASGYYALYSNTTGYANTASGLDAMYSNGTGHDNAAVGLSALYSNTTGSLNTGTGDSAMLDNTTGSWNTANGFEALDSNSTGSENTAVGAEALLYSETGSDLTAVGFDSGSNETQLRNATALGAHSTVDQSNSLILGQTTAGSPGASYVNVGVGTATPRSAIEVAVNAPSALGPVLTLTNSGKGGSAIDFNTSQPAAASADYAPAARILAYDNGGGSSGVVFQSGGTGGLRDNLVVDGNGGVHVPNALDAGMTNTRIDDPLDPANKYLVHSSVQSSEMMNIYTGNVVTDELGLATVKLPGWFEAENSDFRYQLTVMDERFAQAVVSKKIQNGQFTIHTNASNVEVSWQITAVRQDAYAQAHPLVVEQQKAASERGFYLHPELYGQSAERQAGASHMHDQPASAVAKNFPVPAPPEVEPPARPETRPPARPGVLNPIHPPAARPVARLDRK